MTKKSAERESVSGSRSPIFFNGAHFAFFFEKMSTALAALVEKSGVQKNGAHSSFFFSDMPEFNFYSLALLLIFGVIPSISDVCKDQTYLDSCISRIYSAFQKPEHVQKTRNWKDKVCKVLKENEECFQDSLKCAQSDDR